MFCSKCGAPRQGESQFCAQCGTPFVGQTVTPNGEQQYQAPVSAPAAPAAPSNVSLYFKKLFAIIIALFKKPAKTMKDFAKEGDFKVALGIMAGESVAFFVAFWFLIMTIAIKMKDVFEFVEMPYIQICLISLIIPFLLSLLFAAILLLCNNVFFKGKNTYKQMLCVGAGASLARAIFVVGAAVVGFIFGLIKMEFGLAIVIFFFACAIILSFFLTGAALKGVSENDDDKRLFTLFIAFAIMFVATAIMLRGVLPICIPDISFLNLMGGGLFN